MRLENVGVWMVTLVIGRSFLCILKIEEQNDSTLDYSLQFLLNFYDPEPDCRLHHFNDKSSLLSPRIQ